MVLSQACSLLILKNSVIYVILYARFPCPNRLCYTWLPRMLYFRCGGVTARVIKRRIMRVPHFVTDSMQQAHKLSQWLIDHFDELKAKASEVSQHCKLQSLQPWFIGTAMTSQNCLVV